MAEFSAEGRGRPDDDSMVGHELRSFGPIWSTEEGFAQYVTTLRAAALEETPRPEGHVPSTTWWWVAGPEYLGRLAFRHRLTDHLREVGGHIGYDVRPSARRRGHATAMLAAALPLVRAMGVDDVLVTCDVDNIGSRRVIESAGGRFEDERGGKLRFWVATGAQ
jgi:predicted acetyltransferase